MSVGSYISTIGVEFEGVISPIQSLENSLSSSLRSLLSSVTHDASVESEMSYIGSDTKLYLGSSKMRNSRYVREREKTVSGFELVSKPLTLSDVSRLAVLAVNEMVQHGEIYSPRSSIHYHVGFPRDFMFTKPALKVGMKIEPLMYKIAGMGRAYRGSINDSAFARSFSCPPAVRLDRGGYAILSPEGALKADSMEDFWMNLGVYIEDVQRYHPARYFGINILSQLLRGTLEFRHCNYSQDPESIISVASFCQNVTELMLKAPDKLIEKIYDVSVTEENSDIEYHKLLDSVLDVSRKLHLEFPMSERFINGFRELIENTPQFKISGVSSLTHLERYTLSSSFVERSLMKEVEDVKPSGVVNIHNFSADERSLI